ncbi:MAG TPA: trypsin-like peptidase domain-containing protein [Terrimicrobiaceae bacterium]
MTVQAKETSARLAPDDYLRVHVCRLFMKSLLRFLLFVVIAAAAVGLLYLWRNSEPAVETSSLSQSNRSLLTALDREFTTLVNQVLPSVVSIEAIPADAIDPRLQMLRWLFGGNEPNSRPSGSGVIVSDEGHIVTNLHVVNGASAVQVQLADGRTLPAKFVGADGPSDIAILKIEAEDLRPLPFGDSDKVKVGQMVFAVGNPLGLQETVTQGIISAKGRRALSEAANEFFQTDAAVNPGNSGGPLVNLEGSIIGINNSISPQGQGIGFAIPSNTVRRVFESIRDHGRFIRPWFGAYMRSLTPQLAEQLGLPDASGVLVMLTYEGSPAEKSGVKPGDVIVEFNGKAIRDLIDLRNRVVETSIGQNFTMRVRRDGEEMTLQTVLTAEPAS